MHHEQNIGGVYRELRQARGLKLKDVARDNLSVSQLSKFENGISMLSADRLLLAIEGIQMSFEEFGYVLTQYRDSQGTKVLSRATILHVDKDVAGLEALLVEIEEMKVGERLRYLYQICIKCFIAGIEPSRSVPYAELEEAIVYLYGIDVWTDFEIVLLATIVSHLPIKDMIYLGESLLERAEVYEVFVKNHWNVLAVLIDIMAELMMHRRFDAMPFFEKAFKKKLRFYDTWHSVIYQLQYCMHPLFKGESRDLKPAQDFVAHVACMSDEFLTKQIRANYTNYVKSLLNHGLLTEEEAGLT